MRILPRSHQRRGTEILRSKTVLSNLAAKHGGNSTDQEEHHFGLPVYHRRRHQSRYSPVRIPVGTKTSIGELLSKYHAEREYHAIHDGPLAKRFLFNTGWQSNNARFEETI